MSAPIAHQPQVDFAGRLQHVDYSSCCYSSSAASGFYRRGTSLKNESRLWITTAIHLDTQIRKHDPIQRARSAALFSPVDVPPGFRLV